MHAPYDRLARLRDLREDILGWGHIDLGTVLAAWDFESRSLGVSYGTEQVLWYHPSDPGRLSVVLPSRDGIAASIVERVIWVIEDSAR